MIRLAGCPSALSSSSNLPIVRSSSATAAVVRELAAGEPRVHLLLRTTDRGLGSAVRAGFAEALRLGADYIGQTDADGSHDPAVFPRLLERLRGGSADASIKGKP